MNLDGKDRLHFKASPTEEGGGGMNAFTAELKADKEARITRTIATLPDFLKPFGRDPSVLLSIASGKNPFAAAARAFILEVTSDRRPASVQFFNDSRIQAGQLAQSGKTEEGAYAEILCNVVGPFSPVSFQQPVIRRNQPTPQPAATVAAYERTDTTHMVQEIMQLAQQKDELLSTVRSKLFMVYLPRKAIEIESAKVGRLDDAVLAQAFRAVSLHNTGAQKLKSSELEALRLGIKHLRVIVDQLFALDQSIAPKSHHAVLPGHNYAAGFGYTLGQEGIATMMTKRSKASNQEPVFKPAHENRPAPDFGEDEPGVTWLTPKPQLA